MTAPDCLTVLATRAKKAGGALLSKRITLGDDGRPVSDGSPCQMTNGVATRVTLDGAPATALAALIAELGSHEAIILGDHVADPEQIEIAKASHADPSQGRYGRTLETFRFREGEPAPVLLDYDQKGISDSARARIEALGGFEGAITSLLPSYPTLARVIRASTSAGLRNEDTGETFPGNGGKHAYLFVQDGADIPRFLRDLQKRAWLAGLGWIMVAGRGALLVRSIIDVTVGSPERLVFEGRPHILPPLAQDDGARQPTAYEGELLDTTTACPPLTPSEERQFLELVEAAKREKKPEVETAKEQAAVSLSARSGITLEKARTAVEASTSGELGSYDVLHFDDEAIGEVSVADVLADPARFHGETLADPIEGRSYGRGKAQLYWNANNTVIINSFAHGGCVYTLRHDADYIEEKVEDAGEDAPFVLAELMARAGSFDAVTRERLRDLAAKTGKVGKRAVSQTIKETAQKAKRAAGAASRERPGGHSNKSAGQTSRQPLFLIGGERPKALRAIEAALRKPEHITPGAIIARGQAASVIRRAVDPVKLQAGKIKIDLPTGSAYLAVAKPEHLQAQLDRLFAFSKMSREGEEYSVDCPPDLARHALANAELLPVQFISRTPVLRPDGSVLDRPGYDPTTAIFYAPDEAFPAIPSEPTQEDAAAALDRLRHPFREFPFVTDVDRDAVAAEVLSLLTRHLVPRAPAFVHNAVEAGSGKTKLFETVALIAIGTNAPLLNADVLGDETELKKVLTTLTLAAAPLVVFDNVIRGGQITSPGLSNYLTATVYGDRLLGSNTEVKAATCTLIGLTGNAVEVAGDNTRRMFRIDLDAGVERPETREFGFDCEAEAKQDRGELVAAALTILRAHALAGWPGVSNRAPLGSFEDWDRLVVGAIVFAGGADIVTLMDKTRAADPERDDLAEVLRMLDGIGATTPMKVGEIVREVEKRKAASEGFPMDMQAIDWHDLLCRLGSNGVPNSRRLGRYLTKNAGRIAGGLQLISDFDSDAKVNRYCARPVRPMPWSGPGKAAPYGVYGVYGVSHSRSTSHELKNDSHSGSCGNDTFIKRVGADRPSQTPETPLTPYSSVSPTNGASTCDHCREPILPGDGFSANENASLHYLCVDAWSRP